MSLDRMQMSAVRELANIGVGRATTALSELAQRPLGMSVPNCDVVSLEKIPAMVGSPTGASIGIYMPITGEIAGHMAFLLPWEGAQDLWSVLLGSAPSSIDDVTEMQASAMMEAGNIVISSFVSAMADMTDLCIYATPSLMAMEMSGAIISSVVSQAWRQDPLALLIRTQILDRKGGLDGFFVYLPTRDSLNLLFKQLGILEAA